MPLTKKDLSNIEALIKANTEPIVCRIDRLEENINRRFDENAREHDLIMERIDNLSKRENEDIAAIVEDVDKIKIRLKKAASS